MKENNRGPQCVGFIMDGNRRFATDQNKETLEGHKAGKDTFLEVVDWIYEVEIPHAVFYAFSTENWQRKEVEVNYLMTLFRVLLEELKNKIKDKAINVRVVGRIEDFAEDIQNSIRELEAKNVATGAKTTIWVGLSYGGRPEILAAVNKAIALSRPITEAEFSQLLWTKGMPDPDIIIRTGGDKRLSNFLPWQSVYSELFFTETYWPAFTKSEFQRILSEYADRERRHGR